MKRTEIKLPPSHAGYTAHAEHDVFAKPSGDVLGCMSVELTNKKGKGQVIGNCLWLVGKTPDITVKYPKAVHVDDIDAINEALSEFKKLAKKYDSNQ